MVVQRVREPDVWGTVAGSVEDLAIKLGGSMDAPDRTIQSELYDAQILTTKGNTKADSRDVAVDDLDHHQRAIISHNIVCLSLYIGVLVGTPPQVVLGELGVRGILSLLLGDRLDGFRAIYRFLRARNGGQTIWG